MTKRVSPAVLHPLKEALTNAFWYKADLRAFLRSCLGDSALVAHLDWTAYKRTVVSQLVTTLAQNQHRYFDQLLDLLLATADIRDPQHLKPLEDGQAKYQRAVGALDALRHQVEPYRILRSEAEEADRRRRESETRAALRQAVREKLSELRSLLDQITTLDAQSRGYALEQLLNELFTLFDIDARGPFRISGEQIDGAFTFEGTEFLFEARWRERRAELSDLDSFVGKVGRKLDNTLGLFLSINGFQQTAIENHSRTRPSLLLMDGSDLVAVMEDRIGLPDLLTRKRQHAARTGEILLNAYTILC